VVVPGVEREDEGPAAFFDMAARQRACREFRDDPVDEATVLRLLEVATRAPSAENTQPWVFVVVRDAQRRAAIGELTRRAWTHGARQFSEGRLSPGLLEDVEGGALGGIAAAPVLVVVAGDTRLAVEAVLGASIYPAVQNLLLGATALGLGSALTTLPTVAGSEFADLVGLPPEVKPLAVVPLGWPARRLGPSRRVPVADKAHAEVYGVPLAGGEA
jgi:nitroreductase